jgi:arylsulfatase
MPTLVEVAMANYPEQRQDKPIFPMAGISLMPVLRGEHVASRNLFFEHEGNRAVAQGQWKLTALKSQPWELYDLQNDSSEMKNQYTNPEYAEVVADLKRQLRETRAALKETDENYPHVQAVIDAHTGTPR